MGFKYKVEPAQEWLGAAILTLIFAPWLLLIVMLPVAAVVSKILAYKESKKSPEQKLKELIERLSKNKGGLAFYPGNYDHFPTNNGWSEKEADEHMGGHWAVDPHKKNPNLVAHDVVPLSEYLKIIKKYAAYVAKVAALPGDSNIIKNIDNATKACFSKDEIVFKDKHFSSFNLKSGDVKWPNSEWYLDPEKCFASIRDASKTLGTSFSKLGTIVEKVLSKPTEGASNEELQARLAFVSTCDEIAAMCTWIAHDISDNFYRLNDELNVGFVDAEDGSFTYL